MSLTEKRCVPCEGGASPLSPEAADELLAECPGWVRERDWIHREVICKDFVEAVDIIRDIADIAEDEGHHPDLHLTGYKNLRISLQTHAVGGLSENDFIVAAKVGRMLAQR